MTVYTKAAPYDSAKTYDGAELVPAVGSPNNRENVDAPWRQAQPTAAVIDAGWRDPVPRSNPVDVVYGTADPHTSAIAAPWRMPTSRAAHYLMPFGDLETAQALSGDLPWGAPLARFQGYELPFGDLLTAEAAPTDLPYSAPASHAQPATLPWATARPRSAPLTAFWKAAIARGALIALPWGEGIRRQYSSDIIWPVDPNPGTDPITVPIRPVYIMLPSVSAVVLPDRTSLPILSASTRTDVDSWAWSFNASIPIAAMPQVQPEGRAEPVEIEINWNGYVWTFAVTKAEDQTRFGSRTARISGASRSMVLGADFAPKRTYIETANLTAAQIADQALIGTGWTLAWDAVDWLIPGGTYSAQDQAVIDELVTLANVAGARIESDRAALSIAVKPGFATMPWQLDEATPYAIIPASILTSRSGATRGGRNSDGVYILSESIRAFVKIDGSAGAELASPVTERLILNSDVAQERGRIELAKASKIRDHQVTLPLFPGGGEPGLIPLDAWLLMPDDGDGWLGRVVSVEVTGQRGDGLTVRQNLTLERHYR